MSESQIPPHLAKPPAGVPTRFMTGSISLCARAAKEADTNLMTITGAFNQMTIGIAHAIGLPALPIPSGYTYIRIHTEGPRSFEWALYLRVLEWAGQAQDEGAVALVAAGNMEIQGTNKGMGEVAIPTIGGAFRLTPQRAASFLPNVALLVRTRYELWHGSEFLVAHGVDFTYNIVKEATADGKPPAEEQPAGA